MSAQHTPGPWHVGPVIDGEVDDIPEIVIQRAAAPLNLSVAVALGGLSGQEANARLIAAAPDLLHACRKAVLALAALSETCPTLIQEYEIVSAAIAKATGNKA